MKIKFGFGKDGGRESTVWGWFAECKALASIVLLRFEPGSRDAYHSHAFDAVSLLLKGELREYHLEGGLVVHRAPKIIVTRRDTFHKVVSVGRSYVLSLRGPWAPTWQEWQRGVGRSTLTSGRVKVGEA